MTSAHEEKFNWEIDTYARSGDMEVRSYPDNDGVRTIYEFRTK